jgi:hypothetical protein
MQGPFILLQGRHGTKLAPETNAKIHQDGYPGGETGEQPGEVLEIES